MAGRESVWSDARIIERAREFVPATDEVWRLQRGLGPESLAFQRMANAGHYRAAGGSRQGIYVCTPGGLLLASANTLNADKVLALLDDGLARWNALDTQARSAALAGAEARAEADPEAGSEVEPEHAAELAAEPRWEDSFPADGLVLRSWNRDLPTTDDPGAAPPHKRSNLDHAWFSAREMRGFLPPALRGTREAALPDTGDKAYAVAESAVVRLARFHLVDNVRGQTLPFAQEEVRLARLDGRILGERDGELVLGFQGRTLAATDGTWRMGANDWEPGRPWPRSMWTELVGEARWSVARERFTAFTLVALAEREGRTGLNGRRDDERGRLGIVFDLVASAARDRIAPAYVDVYDAPWIRSLEGNAP